jgi:hypothetical protein
MADVKKMPVPLRPPFKKDMPYEELLAIVQELRDSIEGLRGAIFGRNLEGEAK